MKCLLTGVFLCLFTPLFAQQSFIKTFDMQANEWGWCVRQNNDKGYIISGQFNNKAFLIKTDKSGNEIWTKNYGEEPLFYYMGYIVRQTNDNGFILISGVSEAGTGENQISIIKTNSTGDTLWTKKIKDSRTGPSSFEINNDGDFIFACNTRSQELVLMKTTNRGEIIWQKYPLTNGSSFYSNTVIQTKDGGYLILGKKINEMVMLIKTDKDGNLLWTSEYTNNVMYYPEVVIQTTDEGYAVAGSAYNINIFNRENSDLSLFKTDTKGKIEWSKTYGGFDYDQGHSVIQNPDLGYLIAGDYQKNDGDFGHVIYLVKTDSKGDTIWTRKIDILYVAYGGYSLQKTDDNGFVMTGYAYDDTPNKKELAFLLKTDENGKVKDLSNEISFQSNSFSISPNPASESIEIQFDQNTTGAIEILNLQGTRVYYSKIVRRINVSEFQNGIYLVKLYTKNGCFTQKFIKS
jgi:hypothetical protein